MVVEAARQGGDVLLAAAVVLLVVLVRRLRVALRAEQRVTESLERANRTLEHFATLVSHDLREPLHAIAISSERLAGRLDGRLDEEERELLGYVRAGTQEMRGLIDGFLSAARGRLPRRDAPAVSARAAVEQALAALEPRVSARGARIEIGELPRVAADPAALRSVFQNLLSNALKFVPVEREPEIRVSAERLREAWRFAVADNGVGVDPGEVDDVFAMLARGAAANRFPGTGVGLASCRAVVERQGGRIWIEPRPGGGTTVAFTIPARRDERVGAEPVAETSSSCAAQAPAAPVSG